MQYFLYKLSNEKAQVCSNNMDSYCFVKKKPTPGDPIGVLLHFKSTRGLVYQKLKGGIGLTVHFPQFLLKISNNLKT